MLSVRGDKRIRLDISVKCEGREEREGERRGERRVWTLESHVRRGERYMAIGYSYMYLTKATDNVVTKWEGMVGLYSQLVIHS